MARRSEFLREVALHPFTTPVRRWINYHHPAIWIWGNPKTRSTIQFYRRPKLLAPCRGSSNSGGAWTRPYLIPRKNKPTYLGDIRPKNIRPEQGHLAPLSPPALRPACAFLVRTRCKNVYLAGRAIDTTDAAYVSVGSPTSASPGTHRKAPSLQVVVWLTFLHVGARVNWFAKIRNCPRPLFLTGCGSGHRATPACQRSSQVRATQFRLWARFRWFVARLTFNRHVFGTHLSG